jgi:hypothetical protein
MKTYKVVDHNRIEVDRTVTESIEEACVVARVMSRSSDDYSSAIYFVVDNEFLNIKYMFHDGRKFKAED